MAGATNILVGIDADDTEIPILSDASLIVPGRFDCEGEKIRCATIISGSPEMLSGCERGVDQDLDGSQAAPHAAGALMTQADPAIRGLLYRATGVSTPIANTTAETIFDRTFTIPAQTLTVGKLVRLRAAGNLDSAGAHTLTARVRLGNTLVGATGPISSSALAGVKWMMDFELQITAIGTAGAVVGIGRMQYLLTTATATGSFFLGTAGFSDVALDTTIPNDLTISMQWSVANPGNTIDLRYLTIEALN